MRFVRGSEKGRLLCIAIALMGLTGCGKTGHLAETTLTPGEAVTGRGGRPVAELPTAEQQLARDMKECAAQASVTVPDDRLALLALAGAASGVLAAHGGLERAQGGIKGATNAINQASASDGAITEEIKEAADWKASDCLKKRGWDAIPRFMYR